MKVFSVTSHDFDAEYFEDAPDDLFCPNCGTLLKPGVYVPKKVGGRAIKSGFSHSGDGIVYASQDAKNVMDRHATGNFDFVQVNDKPVKYAFFFHDSVAFDAQRTGTRFVDKCRRCGNFESIVGVTPGFLKPNQEIGPFSVCRTDLVFASGREKDPLLIVGEELAKILMTRFPKLHFEELATT